MIECFKKIFSKVLFVVLCSVTSMSICAQESLSLSNGKINILWEKHEGKWVMTLFEGKTPEGYKMFGRPSGKYNLIYDNVKPTIKPLAIVENGDTLDFPEQTFRYVKPDFLRAISAVPMNRAGRYSTFFPDRGWKEGGTVVFEHPTEYGVYKAKWEFDDKYHSDINVEISLTVNQEGYYSLPTPTISTLVGVGRESYQDFIRGINCKNHSLYPMFMHKGYLNIRCYAVKVPLLQWLLS